MKALLLASGLVLASAGAAAAYPTYPPPSYVPVAPAGPSKLPYGGYNPPPIYTPPAQQIPAPPPPLPLDDQCGARALEGYAGRHFSLLPPTPQGVVRRVVAIGDLITMDYRPNRQTIWHDRFNGLITSIRCG